MQTLHRTATSSCERRELTGGLNSELEDEKDCQEQEFWPKYRSLGGLKLEVESPVFSEALY